MEAVEIALNETSSQLEQMFLSKIQLLQFEILSHASGALGDKSPQETIDKLTIFKNKLEKNIDEVG